MNEPVFVHLSTDDIATFIHQAKRRVNLCMPGLTQAIAAAVVNASNSLGRSAVTVVIDVDEKVSRYGYGEFDAVALLMEGNVDVRMESGLRTCVLITDANGYAFFSPPMLVETRDEASVGINALALIPAQVESVLKALGQSDIQAKPGVENPAPPIDAKLAHSECAPSGASALEPQIGAKPVCSARLEEVRIALESNPPQKFDLARKVNVFNAFIEFVELRLIGLRIGSYTVQLPKGLGLALRDDATARRLLTTFKLVSEDSKVAKEAVAIDKKLRQLREVFTRSLGEGLGSVMLRSKRTNFENAIVALRQEIAEFQSKVIERLDHEIAQSRKKLVEGLWQAVKRAPPLDLESQVSGPITSDLVKRYVDLELSKVFPDAKSLISEMRLEFVVKGVTYDVLTNPEFQEKVRQAFPLEDFDRPFREFEAAPAIQPSLFPFGGLK